MKGLDTRIARVTVEDNGDWILTVAGTDIYRKLWNDEDVAPGTFPGLAMGVHLIEEGWRPDRRGSYSARTHSPVERMLLTVRAGWREAGEKSWTIPCYREKE